MVIVVKVQQLSSITVKCVAMLGRQVIEAYTKFIWRDYSTDQLRGVEDVFTFNFIMQKASMGH